MGAEGISEEKMVREKYRGHGEHVKIELKHFLSRSSFFFSSLAGTGVESQGFMIAKQVLYRLSHSASSLQVL